MLSSRNNAPVLQWLAVGVFINCLAQVPFVLLQAAGRPDATAKLHMCELPFYLAALFALVHWRGVVGAAIAWTLRVTIDAILLYVVADRLSLAAIRQSRFALVMLGSVSALCLSSLPLGTAAKLAAHTDTLPRYRLAGLGGVDRQ